MIQSGRSLVSIARIARHAAKCLTVGFVATYPWWPAIIFEPDTEGIPERVLDSKPDTQEKLHLVRFYDKNLSW